MAAELVNAATSDKLTEVDWTKSIEICELVAKDHRQARDVIKAIKKRIASKNANTQLFSVMLLEVLMNNIGEPIHRQVIDTGLLPILVKIIKKKSDLPVQEKIFLLLDATQTSLGGASGRFPQYYSAYYELVSAGVQFPQRNIPIQKNHPSLNTNHNQSSNGQHASSGHEINIPKVEPQIVPESSIIQKASAALEVIREVLDAVDTKHPEGAKDEFTLDLVEQCSFQKQRVMQVAMTSRDEKVVSQAVELNDKLQKILARHDELVSGRATSASNRLDREELEEEEEPEQLFRRIRKGKACVRPEDENCQPLGLLGSSIPGNRLHRPLIRPQSVEPKQDPNTFRPAVANSVEPEQDPNTFLSAVTTSVKPKQEPSKFCPAVSARSEPKQEPNTFRPVVAEPKQAPDTFRPTVASLMEPKDEHNVFRPTVAIPPPPAKHIEREKFFKENKLGGSALSSHVRGLSIHSHSSSSSHSESLDSD